MREKTEPMELVNTQEMGVKETVYCDIISKIFVYMIVDIFCMKFRVSERW